MTTLYRFFIIACVALAAACAGDRLSAPDKNIGVECVEPRREICPKVLRPVCATRDTGVRCVTTPCDSTEEATYPNDCLACADPAVYGYREGACEE